MSTDLASLKRTLSQLGYKTELAPGGLELATYHQGRRLTASARVARYGKTRFRIVKLKILVADAEHPFDPKLMEILSAYPDLVFPCSWTLDEGAIALCIHLICDKIDVSQVAYAVGRLTTLTSRYGALVRKAAAQCRRGTTP